MKKRRLLSKWLILPIIVVAMVSVLTIGFTMAAFNDSETSNANNASAWTSTQWTQTSQADFNAGVLTNVNTTLSVDNVILSAGSGAGANMTLFWDGGAAPSGWTLVSTAGQPFNNVFPRGAATYGGTGGNGGGTHSHTVSLDSIGPPSPTIQVTSGGTNRASSTHTHALVSGSTGTVSNLPSYRQLRVIRYNGVPTTIPAGAIAIFDTTPPAGWTRYSAQDNYFVRGSGTVGTLGGTNDDTHTIPNLAATSNYTGVTATGTPVTVGTIGHTHTLGSTNSIDKRPPYIEVIYAKADSATAIPGGLIAMFDASPTGGWSILSGSGSPFESRFIVGSASYGTTGGASSHQPTGPTTSSTSSGSANGGTATPSVFVAAQPHTHSVTLSFDSVSNIPPHIDVIFAKALYTSSGTIASQVLNSNNVTGSRWDGLVWDTILPSGTSITFEVRAQDASFAKDAGSPSWTSVGSTSPVISGLTSGRYKQWRATLTPNGAQTSTPTLQEIRVYYYGG